MTWFAANLIIWSRSFEEKEHGDGPCHVWERVLVVQADDVDEATHALTEFAQADVAGNSENVETGDNLGADQLAFMGIRKIREVEGLAAGGDSPIEVMFSEMEVRSKADLLKLAAGGDVIVRYID
ncbi:MAG: hypothetical protein JO194_09875 [Candidatus Eremiobacteraeota bacterium]|nr:hypothetical protein [Candidatus Eremiobacteraeota bacterium]